MIMDTKSEKCKVVIMAGGKGERFWPLSTFQSPKQLLSVVGKKTMLQETVERLSSLVSFEDILIVARDPLGEEIGRQLPELPKKNILLEPVGRNTAPCIGWAASSIKEEDCVMVVLPADHIIKPKSKFIKILKAAISQASCEDVLITLGIKPAYPATGYGYIRRGARGKGQESRVKGQESKVKRQESRVKIYKVERFVEKPDERKAKEFLRSGKYYWNSGMFVWRKSVILGAMKKYLPELYRQLNYLRAGTKRKTIKKIYPKLPKVSIDYGVMEKAKNTLVIPGDFSWDDLGSWESVEKYFLQDKEGNILEGKGKLIRSKGCFLLNKDEKHLICGINLENLIVVSTKKALLILPKGKGQEIKKLVGELNKEKSLKEYL